MTKPTLQAVDPNTPTTQPAPDPFDLASLRLNPSFLETAGVKKLLTTVPARRPSPQDFVRVHPAPEYRENFAMIDLKDDREDFSGTAGALARARRRSRLQDDLHGDQSAGRVFLVAGPPPGARRSQIRLVSLGA